MIAAEFPDVVVSYASSGTIARQISQGAPADIVLLAHVDWMDYLRSGGFVQPQTIADFASNQLVMIGTAGTPSFSKMMESNTLPDEQLPQSPMADMAAIASSAAGFASSGWPP